MIAQPCRRSCSRVPRQPEPSGPPKGLSEVNKRAPSDIQSAAAHSASGARWRPAFEDEPCRSAELVPQLLSPRVVLRDSASVRASVRPGRSPAAASTERTGSGTAGTMGSARVAGRSTSWAQPPPRAWSLGRAPFRDEPLPRDGPGVPLRSSLPGRGAWDGRRWGDRSVSRSAQAVVCVLPTLNRTMSQHEPVFLRRQPPYGPGTQLSPW